METLTAGLLFISLIIIIAGIIMFVIEAIQYRNFTGAVNVFNKASAGYSEGLREVQTVVNTQGDAVIEMGKATEANEEMLAKHTAVLEIQTITIKALTTLLESMLLNKELDITDEDVVSSEGPVGRTE